MPNIISSWLWSRLTWASERSSSIHLGTFFSNTQELACFSNSSSRSLQSQSLFIHETSKSSMIFAAKRSSVISSDAMLWTHIGQVVFVCFHVSMHSLQNVWLQKEYKEACDLNYYVQNRRTGSRKTSEHTGQ